MQDKEKAWSEVTNPSKPGVPATKAETEKAMDREGKEREGRESKGKEGKGKESKRKSRTRREKEGSGRSKKRTTKWTNPVRQSFQTQGPKYICVLKEKDKGPGRSHQTPGRRDHATFAL